MLRPTRGTLFLDEVGKSPLTLRPKRLRFRESGNVRPVGESHARPQPPTRPACESVRGRAPYGRQDRRRPASWRQELVTRVLEGEPPA
ncbi:MAG: sigma 54-interacting transcriptional regulator [Thiotrichales bacterium]